MPAIAVVGSLNMDLVFRTPRAPGPGETLTGRGFAAIPGGKGANQAVACARLAATPGAVAMVGCVGADGFGDTLRAGLAADGVDARFVTRVAEAPTGVALVLVEDDGQNRIVLAPGANAALSGEHIEAARDAIAAARLCVLQLETPPETALRASEIARAAGGAVLLNPAPARDIPDALWGLVDYLVPNESEAAALTGAPVTDLAAARAAARALRARGPAHVLITLGAQGVLLCGPQGERHLPAHSVAVVDSTAAGDSFIGGFAAGLLEGLAPEAAAALGQRAAALCVQRAGAQPSIPFRREL